LGAGKTVLAQGILAGLGVSGRMPSPSFTVIREYKGRHDAWHIDLFRLDGDDDFLALGGDEILLGGRGVAVVEWAERLRGLVPERSVLVRLDVAPEGDGHEVRRLTFDLRGRGFGALDGVLGCWPGQRGGAGRGGGNP
jgi:tRNA threonylcarbamoyladenosine biosynthesis protein TsaE